MIEDLIIIIIIVVVLAVSFILLYLMSIIFLIISGFYEAKYNYQCSLVYRYPDNGISERQYKKAKKYIDLVDNRRKVIK